MRFQEWLAQADEDGRREASEYRHHYPVELQIIGGGTIEDGMLVYQESPRLRVVCGCNEAFMYPFGSEGHR